MNLYKEKYIKYKNKYLELKGGVQSGGGDGILDKLPEGIHFIYHPNPEYVNLNPTDKEYNHKFLNLNTNGIEITKEQINITINPENANNLLDYILSEIKRTDIAAKRYYRLIKLIGETPRIGEILADIYNSLLGLSRSPKDLIERSYDLADEEGGERFVELINNKQLKEIKDMKSDKTYDDLKEEQKKYTKDTFKRTVDNMYTGKTETETETKTDIEYKLTVLQYLIYKLKNNGAIAVIKKTNPTGFFSSFSKPTYETLYYEKVKKSNDINDIISIFLLWCGQNMKINI